MAEPVATTKHEVVVDDLSSGDRDRWATFVQGTPGGSAYQLPVYLDALADAVGGRARILVARRGEEIVGGLALLERHATTGWFVAPRALLHYNGFVLRDYATRYPSERVARRAATLDALVRALERLGHGRLEIRSRPDVTDARGLVARGWQVTPSYTYVVPLDDLPTQWSRVEQNVRRLVERGTGAGLRLVDDVSPAELFALHRRTHERKGTRLYLPEDALRSFLGSLAEAGLATSFGARTPEGDLAAAQLVLLGHPVTHTVVAGAEPALQSLGANAFLRWRVFERLAERGAVANDLTDAAPGPVERFKAQLGGDLQLALVARKVGRAQRAEREARRLARRVGGRLPTRRARA